MTSKPNESKGGAAPEPNDRSELEGSPCVVCRVGTLRRGTSTSTFETEGSPSGGAVIVIRGVPGWVCDSCGEAYHEADVTERLLGLVRSSAQRGAEVEVLRYSASDEGMSSVAA